MRLVDVANNGKVLGAHETLAGAYIHQFSAELESNGEAVVVLVHTRLFAAREKGLEIVQFSLHFAQDVETPLVQDRPRIALFPGHPVLARYTDQLSVQMRVLEIKSLHKLWRPIRDIDWTAQSLQCIHLLDIPALSVETIHLESQRSGRTGTLHLYMYESPLERRKFHIHLHVWHHVIGPQMSFLRRLLSSQPLPFAVRPAAWHFHCSLTLPSATAPTRNWTRRPPVSLWLSASFPDIGYMQAFVPRPNGGEPGSPGTVRPEGVYLPGLLDRTYISRTVHSGALVVVVPSGILVRYHS
ncbi:hypothetical protein C8R43DRAFT_1242331 [Mycena crocata]|nr:hypothetical protein C8R43DRAFT_1242331 [Mycena crocata]